jgi:protein-tyrosine phosphatase
MRILMVCLGNICRSPTAEAVLRSKLESAGLAGRVSVDSAGTYGGHAGEPPDRRAIAHASRRGYQLAALRARLVRVDDFERFDLVLAMDDDNVDELESSCPPEHRGKIGRLASYGARYRAEAIPDPWAGGPGDFERVLDLVEDACDGLIADLAQRLEGNFGGQT